MRRPRPRDLGIICACLILLAAGVVTGVRWAQDKGPLTLLANWSGEEEKQFEKVLEQFKDDHGIKVVYQGSSALSQVLAAGIASGSPPDVAVVPGPGELMTYADEGRLHPLGALFEAGRYDEFWAPEVTPQEGEKGRYWLPVKAGLKSMVWHSKSNEAKVAEFARTPGKWCLAMESGATSGWPGTDWVEDILLQQAGPEEYGKWVTGKLDWRKGHVRKAWETWGEMVGADDQDSMETGLKADFTEACSPQLLEHQGSFRAAGWKEADGDFVHSAEVIPDARKAAKPWEVSGDLAVMLNKSEEAEQLIRYLASPETELPEYTVNTGASPPIDPKTVKGRIALTLRGRNGNLCWDASDAMPRATRDAFQQAVLRYLIAPKTLDAELAALERLRVERTTQLPVCS